MPAIINAAACLIFGSAIALSARHTPSLRRETISWAFILAMGFHAVIGAPVATYLFRFYPQWSMLYAFDPQIFPNFESWFGLLATAAVVTNILTSAAGFMVTRAGAIRESSALAYAPIVVGLALIIGIVFGYYDRIINIGTYDAYWQNDAELLVRTVPGWVGLVWYAVSVAFVSWVGNRFRHREPSFV